MASQPPVPPLTHTDRIGLALMLALTLHALVILGVTFDWEDAARDDQQSRSLEVILVHSQGEAPEQADYLAQANQRGGGNVKEKVRPSSPFPNPQPVTERGHAPVTQDASAPRPIPEKPQTVITARAKSRTQADPSSDSPQPELPLPTAEELRQRSLEMAKLSAEIRENQQSYAKLPRQEWVTANTRKFDTAAYEDAWRVKVERIGNLNYPDEAKRRALSGSLILDVALRADGSLAGVKIQRSSGSKVLDDGAVRIVKLGAPYGEFPPSMHQRIDVLHIVRTWQFESEGALQTY